MPHVLAGISFRHWLRPPRHLLVLFLVTTLGFLIGLGTLGWRSLQQDEALGEQRLRQRLEDATNVIAAELRRNLLELEADLDRLSVMPVEDLDRTISSSASRLGDEAVIVVFDRDTVRAFPRRHLLYYPELPAADEPFVNAAPMGRAADRLPLDTANQIEYLQVLAQAEDERIRAGALLDLGRVQAKAGLRQTALTTFGGLRDPDVLVDGRPAELFARLARVELLFETGSKTELADEVNRLSRDLHDGRWQLTRPTYLHYAAEARRLRERAALPPDATYPNPVALALTEGVHALWRQWREPEETAERTPGRASRHGNGQPTFQMWRPTSDRLVTLVAGPAFLRDRLIDPLTAQGGLQGVGIVLEDGEGRAIVAHGTPATSGQSALRTMAETRLPWTVRVVSTNSAIDRAQLSTRRQLLATGLVFLAILVVTGSYLSYRAMMREIEAVRLKSDFVAAVSHEFRTPLTLLRQFSDLLVDDRVSSEQERRRYYVALQRGVRRLTRLVEDLLDFGRMEAGSRAFTLERVEARGWLEGVVAEFQEEVRSRGYQLECRWAGPASVTVQADASALGRALWNLLDNAVKYSPDRKTIWISGTFERGSLTVAVRDRGLGIPENERRAIFSKFVRGSTIAAQPIKGTGLGLALVEQIIEAHDGHIALESEVGEGSTFSFTLPAEAGEATDTQWRAS